MNEFKIVDGDKELSIKVRKPTVNEQKEAEKIYRKTMKAALDNGDYLRITLDDRLKAQGLWDDNKQNEYNLLVAQIIDGERQVAKSHIKLSEAKEIAMDNVKKRRQLIRLLSSRNALDEITADAQAENEKFRYLTSVCTVYIDSGKPYFKSFDDYLGKADTYVAIWAANTLMKLLLDFDENAEAKWPEYKFLSKWGFVDNKLRPINKDGHLVDDAGRLINEDGYFVDKDGGRVDIDGNPVNDEGEWKVEEELFYDDDGNPILPPNTSVDTEVVVS